MPVSLGRTGRRPIPARLEHAVVEYDIDRRRQVHAAVGGNVNDVLAPCGDVLFQAAVFRAEDVEGAFRVLLSQVGLVQIRVPMGNGSPRLSIFYLHA